MIRLAIRCRAEDAERVLAELLELAPNGVEEEEGDGWFEFAVYGPPGEVPDVGELAATAGAAPIEVSSSEIPDDWADRWRDFHRPIEIGGGRLVVRPSWETALPSNTSNFGTPAGEAEEVPVDSTFAQAPPRTPAGEAEDVARVIQEGHQTIDVVIDPGQAFGTGAHATTSLCLELLIELADDGLARGPLVDLGTGSGVLAIAAAKLGWGPVSGVDSEQASVEAAAENAAVNGVELGLGRVNLRLEAPPHAPTTVANLTAPLLCEVAARLDPDLLPDRLVCSGLLATEADRVLEAFAAPGLEPRTTRFSGDWAAICFGS